MSTDVKIATDKEDKPLTRADVEHRVLEVGGPEKLDLSALNLKGIDLSNFNLMGANLSKANLLGANLSGASLNEANLRKAILRGANLRRANLSEASLREANLQEADLSEADLHNSDLYKANLSEAKLLRANLSLSHMRDADLSNADLSEANLRGTYLLGAYLRGADLHWANLHGAYIFDTRLNWGNLSEHEKEQLRSRGALGLDLVNTETAENASTIRLRITEDPLTTRNLAIIISALTELHTKLWLIQEGRLADLVEYTDTGNTRFEEEAPLIITKLSHNSPTWIEIVTYILSISGGVTVLRKIIDDVVQTRLRYKEEEQKLKEKEQQLTKQRAADLLEIAGKYLDLVAPNADPKSRADIAEKILPTLMKLDQGRGLEVDLPPSISKISNILENK